MERIRETGVEQIERAVTRVQEAATSWARITPAEGVRVLDSIIEGLGRVAEPWVEECCRVKGIALEDPAAGEERIGLGISFRQAHMLRLSLQDMARGELPRIPGPVGRNNRGQVTVQAVPRTLSDRAIFAGMTGQVVMEPDVEPLAVEQGRARLYRHPPERGRVALVLGAGNQACLTTGDVFHKLFVERQSVLFKPNPVLQGLGPLMEDAFREVVRRGALSIVYGGKEVGSRLVQHQQVDEVHMTGGRATYEAIAYTDDGRSRKDKRFTAELGNVSPVVLVPGEWSKQELFDQAAHMAATLTHNAGFNCLTTHLLLTHRDWAGRGPFLEALRAALKQVPMRSAWYPRAHEQWQQVLETHPDAERIGGAMEGQLPWTLVTGLEQDPEEPLVTREHFCPVMAEVVLDAGSEAAFVEKAADFLNAAAWGDLTANLIVGDDASRRADVVAGVEHAAQALRYGTVGINTWGAMSYATGVIPWGTWGGHRGEGQSGRGFVNNALMLEGVRKSIVRGPFRARIRPVELMGRADRLGRALAEYMERPDLARFARLLWRGMRDG